MTPLHGYTISKDLGSRKQTSWEGSERTLHPSLIDDHIGSPVMWQGLPTVLIGKTSLHGDPLSLGWVSSHHMGLKHFGKTSGELWTPYCPSAFIPHLTQAPESSCFCSEACPEAHSCLLLSTLLQVGSKLFLAGGVSVTPSRAPKQNLRQKSFLMVGCLKASLLR